MIGSLGACPIKIPNQVIHRFDSTAEYLASSRKGADRNASSYNGKSAFTKTDNFAEATKLAEDGWSAGREMVSKLTGALISSVSGRIMRHEWVPDVEGQYVDLGLYIAKEPEHWIRPEEHEGFGSARRHLKILYNGSVSCGVDAKVINARGAAIAALAELLELAGDSVSINLQYSVAASPDMAVAKAYVDKIPVKRPGDRVDLNMLMFWLAHPSALRRIAFGSWEGNDLETRRKFGFGEIHGCYGWPCESELEPDEMPDLYISSGYIGTPEGRGLWTDEAATKKWLVETLTQLGVHLL